MLLPPGSASLGLCCAVTVMKAGWRRPGAAGHRHKTQQGRGGEEKSLLRVTDLS